MGLTSILSQGDKESPKVRKPRVPEKKKSSLPKIMISSSNEDEHILHVPSSLPKLIIPQRAKTPNIFMKKGSPPIPPSRKYSEATGVKQQPKCGSFLTRPRVMSPCPRLSNKEISQPLLSGCLTPDLTQRGPSVNAFRQVSVKLKNGAHISRVVIQPIGRTTKNYPPRIMIRKRKETE